MKKIAPVILLAIIILLLLSDCSRNRTGKCEPVLLSKPALLSNEAFTINNGYSGLSFHGNIKSDDFAFTIPRDVIDANTKSVLFSIGFIRADFILPDSADEYKRTYDPCTKIATVDFMQKGTKYKREVFVSAKDSITVIRLTADKPLSLTFSLAAGSSLQHKTRTEERSLITDGIISATDFATYPEGTEIQTIDTLKEFGRFRIFARIINSDGLVNSDSSSINIEKASRATILVSMGMKKASDNSAVDEKMIAARHLGNATFFSYDELKKRHLKFQRKINRTGYMFFGRNS
jgi:hypothetical protein